MAPCGMELFDWTPGYQYDDFRCLSDTTGHTAFLFEQTPEQDQPVKEPVLKPIPRARWKEMEKSEGEIAEEE